MKYELTKNKTSQINRLAELVSPVQFSGLPIAKAQSEAKALMSNIIKQKYRRARRVAEFYSFFGNRKLILAASMPRSASTWMYNVTRILLEEKYPNQVSAGWVADYKTLEKKPVHLIKIHQFDKYWAHRAGIILYSYRDVRDAFASAIRKFGIEPHMKFCDQWIKDDKVWKNCC